VWQSSNDFGGGSDICTVLYVSFFKLIFTYSVLICEPSKGIQGCRVNLAAHADRYINTDQAINERSQR